MSNNPYNNGRIKNSGAQEIKALNSQAHKAKGNDVATGKDLRTGRK